MSCRFPLAMLFLWLFASAANAATFTVTSTADTAGSTCAAICSLRQAITAANATAAADTIVFNISGAGPHLIRPTTALPQIDMPLTIDGYAQPAAAANTLAEGTNAVIKIQIDGALAVGTEVPGIASCASATILRGLAITGFSGHGIRIGRRVTGQTCSTVPTGIVVRGNFIGIAADGHTAAGNARAGVLAHGAGVIGGSAAADRNLIGGGNEYGIQVSMSGVSVDGNLIGTDRTGVLDRANVRSGVQFINASFPGASIGTSARNRIAFGLRGIEVVSGAQGVRIGANDIGPTTLAGIDLSASSTSGDGITPNDIDDVDEGSNRLQNFPDNIVATRTPNGLSISGRLDRPATAGALAYTIAVYANADCGSANPLRQGRRFLGDFVFSSSGPSVENFSNPALAVDVPLPVGSGINLTATDADGNTSEFSACVLVDGSSPTFTVSKTIDTNDGSCDSDCSLREAIVAANANPDGNRIEFSIGGDGTRIIAPTTPLPALTSPALIDGYSQPGAVANSAASGSNASIVLELDGTLISSNPKVGIGVCASDVAVRGLSIVGYSAGIALGADGNQTPCGGSAQGGIVSGNFIGLRADGSTAVGNSAFGVLVIGMRDGRIGGSEAADRNLIASSPTGIALSFLLAGVTRVDGNIIGSDRSGLLDRGNLVGLQALSSSAPGRIAVGERRPNLFRFNGTGVLIGGGSNGLDIHGNQFADNDALGIDLAANGQSPDGISGNDPDDADSGANLLQNFPIVASAVAQGGLLTLAGALDVPQAARRIFRLAAYASNACDSGGHGEGADYLGAVDVVVAGTAEAFILRLANAPPAGRVLTMTASDELGNTSEFSPCVTVGDGDSLFRHGFE